MQTLPERLKAKTSWLLRLARDWIRSVTTTPEPSSVTEEEWEQLERKRARRAAELEIWLRQDRSSDD